MSSYTIVLCVVSWDVNMWVGVILASRGAPTDSYLCGIGECWRKSKSVGEFTIACSFRNVKVGFSWVFVGIYGPYSNFDRRYLWEELDGLLSWWTLSWCLGGDFNPTHFPSERSGEAHFCPERSDEAHFCPAMMELSNFIFY